MEGELEITNAFERMINNIMHIYTLSLPMCKCSFMMESSLIVLVDNVFISSILKLEVPIQS